MKKINRKTEEELRAELNQLVERGEESSRHSENIQKHLRSLRSSAPPTQTELKRFRVGLRKMACD